MDVLGWIKDNILETIILALSVLIAFGGFTFVIIGIQFSEKYSQYDDGVASKYISFQGYGASMAFMGVLMLLTPVLAISLFFKSTCLRIYLLVYLWLVVIFLLSHASVTYSTEMIKNHIEKEMTEKYGDYKNELQKLNEKPAGAPALPADIIPPPMPSNEYIDKVQTQFQCCGPNGPSDFALIQRAPVSCCKPENVVIGSCPLASAYKDGCKKRLEDILDDLSNENHLISEIFFSIVAIGAAVVTSVLICTCCCRRGDS